MDGFNDVAVPVDQIRSCKSLVFASLVAIKMLEQNIERCILARQQVQNYSFSFCHLKFDVLKSLV